MELSSQAPTLVGTNGPLAAARRVTAGVFAAQGAAIAAVYTTVPSVQQHLGLSSTVTTAVMFGVALAAGAGSFAGLAAVRALGVIATMRCALLLGAVAMLIIGWAPDPMTAVCAYLLFGVVIGGIDVSVNTRAAAIERAYGGSVFVSFYAFWSVGGIAAALLTSGLVRLGWPTVHVLTLQAGLVLVLAATIRSHAVAGPPTAGAADAEAGPLRRGAWTRLLPLGLVLLIVFVIDSTVSAWSTVYLHQTLAASLATAPLAYAAYQTGTVTGRIGADHLIRRAGPIAVVRLAALLTAGALIALAAVPSWPFAIPAAGLTGLGVAVLAPLCLASAGRLQPDSTEAVLARLNLFNYAGLVGGSVASGILGSSGHFRLAYAIPALLALVPLLVVRAFAYPLQGRGRAS